MIKSLPFELHWQNSNLNILISFFHSLKWRELSKCTFQNIKWCFSWNSSLNKVGQFLGVFLAIIILQLNPIGATFDRDLSRGIYLQFSNWCSKKPTAFALKTITNLKKFEIPINIQKLIEIFVFKNFLLTWSIQISESSSITIVIFGVHIT